MTWVCFNCERQLRTETLPCYWCDSDWRDLHQGRTLPRIERCFACNAPLDIDGYCTNDHDCHHWMDIADQKGASI